MVESLLLPVVRGVAGKAADALVRSVTRMWGLEADCDKLAARRALHAGRRRGERRDQPRHQEVDESVGYRHKEDVSLTCPQFSPKAL